MRQYLCHLTVLMSTVSILMVSPVSASLCLNTELVYKPYGFQPNCSQSQTLNTRDNLTCTMAAAMSPVASAAVKPLAAGDQCLVVAALCPRYRLTNYSAVLMPASMTALEHIVMSAKSGCDRAVLDVFTLSAPNSDYVVQPAHPDVAVLPDIFRSSLLDNMQRLISRLIYKQFIVQLYMNSSVVVRLVFDVGVSSGSVTLTNWFTQSRLVESWPVMNLSSKSFNVFSIVGDSGLVRRFLINYSYGGCNADFGFLLVSDLSADTCPVFSSSSKIPRFFYNPTPTATWATGAKEATNIAVLVR